MRNPGLSSKRRLFITERLADGHSNGRLSRRSRAPFGTFLCGGPCMRARRAYGLWTTSNRMISACCLSCGLCPRKGTRAPC